MGSRGASSGRTGVSRMSDAKRRMTTAEANKILGDFPKADVEGLKPTKQAEEVFKRTYLDSRKHLEAFDPKDGEIGNWTRLSYGDNEKMSLRAIKGVQAKVNTERNLLKVDLELGVISPKEAVKKHNALKMVQNTINVQYANRKKG